MAKRGRPRGSKNKPKVEEVSEPKKEIKASRSNRESERQRVPFGGFVPKLSVLNKEEGYFYRWFKTSSGRVDRALAAGYDFVSERDARGNVELPQNVENVSVGDRMEVYGGREENGQEYNLVLMRLPQHFRDEDDARKASMADAREEAIVRREFEGVDTANQYLDRVNIQHKLQE